MAGDHEALFNGLFGASQGLACFSRVYDQIHLKSHRRQNVVAVKALVVDLHPGEPIQMRIRFTFKSPSPELETEMNCDPAPGGNGLTCYGVLRGGQANVTVGQDNFALVTVPNGLRLWPPGHYSEHQDDAPRSLGPDDKQFRLERWSDESCSDIAETDIERARIAPPGAVVAPK